jgi:hypothetical protein
MIGRFLITASIAAMLSAAPAVAQQSQQPVYKPPAGQAGQQQSEQSGQAEQTKKVIQPKGSTKSQATGEQPTTQGEQATGEAGEKTKKVQQNTQTGQTTAGEETTGQQKTKKIQQKTEPEQATGKQPKSEGQQATGESGQKPKKIQQGQKTQGSEKMTTGATGKIATEITAKDRTVIRQKLIATHVQRVERSKVKVKIGVGVVIPATIELYPLPADIVALVPAYEGYLYFVLEDGTIVIVEPETLEVAYVLTA